MKTLANCDLEEFLSQAYRAREAFHALYHAAKTDKLWADFFDAARAAKDETERHKISVKYVSRLFWAVMQAEPKKTLNMVAAAAFLTYDEAKKLSPTDALRVLTDCLSSQSVMDFFINAEGLAGSDTGGILLMLILLRQSASGETTSQTALQSSTSADAEQTQSPDTSESASAD